MSSTKPSKSRRETKPSKSPKGAAAAAPPPPSAPKASADEIASLEDAFNRFDLNSDGRISAAELRQVYASIGRRMTEEEAAAVVAKADVDGNGSIDIDEFVRMMRKGDRRWAKADTKVMKEMRDMFELLDEDDDGFLSRSELCDAIRRMSPEMSDEDVEETIKDAAFDKEGRLGFREFVKFMKA